MDLYEPLKLFKAWNRHTRWSLEIMEWCSEDIIIRSFTKILLKFTIVLKIFEYFCPFLSLMIITSQRSFSSLADGLHDKNTETKNVLEPFLYFEMWKLFFGILYFQLFLKWLVTNKFRKLEVVESNLMEKFFSSLSLSLCWLPFLSFSFSLTFNLSLSLSPSLLKYFVDAALQWLLYGVMSSSITPSTKLNLSSLNIGWGLTKPTARRSFGSNSPDVSRLCYHLFESADLRSYDDSICQLCFLLVRFTN